MRFCAALRLCTDCHSASSRVSGSGGVFWRTVDYVLPDIDRVEVVRGPGATLWGANAVNGVISIISKDAKDTQGLLVDSYAGHPAMRPPFWVLNPTAWPEVASRRAPSTAPDRA